MRENRDIQSWWASNPMTYGTSHGRTVFAEGCYAFGTSEFYQRLDRELYSWNAPLHGARPFDRLFPYEDYTGGKDVLEVGCGLGTMLANWAGNGSHVTGVDLNPVAVRETRSRFRLHNLQGKVCLMDSHNLAFPDATFDYAYSWGVMHHSPNLARSIGEMMRVIKPGGGFGLMLYNRDSMLYRYGIEYVEGFLHMERRFLAPLELASRYGDGSREEGNPHTWPVKVGEVLKMLKPWAKRVRTRVLGTDLDSWLRYMAPGLGLVLPRWAKKPWARRYGWSLWFEGHKDR